MSNRRRMIVNILLYQAGWFALVWGAGNGHLFWCLPLALGFVFAHLLTTNQRSDWLFLIVAVVVGALWECVLLATATLQYVSASHESWPPSWIVVVWALFATTVNHSLGWLGSRMKLAAVLGAILGPLAYLAAERLGAVRFIDQPSALLFLAVGWSALMPLLFYLAQRCLQCLIKRVNVEGEV